MFLCCQALPWQWVGNGSPHCYGDLQLWKEMPWLSLSRNLGVISVSGLATSIGGVCYMFHPLVLQCYVTPVYMVLLIGFLFFSHMMNLNRLSFFFLFFSFFLFYFAQIKGCQILHKDSAQVRIRNPTSRVIFFVFDAEKMHSDIIWFASNPTYCYSFVVVLYFHSMLWLLCMYVCLGGANIESGNVISTEAVLQVSIVCFLLYAQVVRAMSDWTFTRTSSEGYEWLNIYMHK